MKQLRLPLIFVTAAVFLSACGKNFDRADAGNSEAVRLGQELYGKNCAACHGADLGGQANWQTAGADGTLPAPPLNDSAHAWQHGDRLLFKYTKWGGAVVSLPDFKSAMPSFRGTLSDAEIWATLSYVKSTWDLGAQASQTELNE